jgi:hypothetical protein
MRRTYVEMVLDVEDELMGLEILTDVMAFDVGMRCTTSSTGW